MKTQLFTGVAAIALLFGSCAKDNDSLEKPKAINFKGEINELVATTSTGNTITNWLTNDEIGIFMLNNGSNVVAENNRNRQYVYTAGQFSPTSGNEIYFPVNNSSVDFIAYYPYKAEYDLSTPIVLNVANQTDLSKLDFLYAKSNNGGIGFNKNVSSTVPLTFDHKLSKITIKPVAGTGLNSTVPAWNTMNVTIQGLNSTCNFDLNTGNTSAPSTPVTISPFTRIAGNTYEAIAIPHEYATAGAISFNFQIGSDIYVWSSSTNEKFEAGKEYTYTVTINKTGLVLSNVSINDWTSVGRTGVAN